MISADITVQCACELKSKIEEICKANSPGPIVINIKIAGPMMVCQYNYGTLTIGPNGGRCSHGYAIGQVNLFDINNGHWHFKMRKEICTGCNGPGIAEISFVFKRKAKIRPKRTTIAKPYFFDKKIIDSAEFYSESDKDINDPESKIELKCKLSVRLGYRSRVVRADVSENGELLHDGVPVVALNLPEVIAHLKTELGLK